MLAPIAGDGLAYQQQKPEISNSPTSSVSTGCASFGVTMSGRAPFAPSSIIMAAPALRSLRSLVSRDVAEHRRTGLFP